MKKLFLATIILMQVACSEKDHAEPDPNPPGPVFTGNVLHVGEGQEYPTLADAIKNVTPGDTILLHPGRYESTNYYPKFKGGEPDKYITIKAESEGTVFFSGKDAMWWLREFAYINFYNLTFEKHERHAFNMDDGGKIGNPLSHHIRMVNCTFKGNAAGGDSNHLKMAGIDYFEIINCTFIDGDNGAAIDMVGCHHGLIKNCYFENTGLVGIQAKGGSQHIRIEGNFMKNCGDRSLNLGGSTGFDFFRPHDATFEAADLQVYSNVIVGSTAPIAFASCVRVEVANNTIISPNKWVLRILQDSVYPQDRFVKCGNNSFINNIIYRNNSVLTDCNIGDFTDPNSFTFANNLWYNYENPKWNGPTNIPVLDEDKIVGKNPMFKDVANEDFSLQSGSPAISKGRTITEPEYDFSGKPFAKTRSIGAYEKQ